MSGESFHRLVNEDPGSVQTHLGVRALASSAASGHRFAKLASSNLWSFFCRRRLRQTERPLGPRSGPGPGTRRGILTCARQWWSRGSWSGWSGPCSWESSWRPRTTPVRPRRSRSAASCAPAACGPPSSAASQSSQTLQTAGGGWLVTEFELRFYRISAPEPFWLKDRRIPAVIVDWNLRPVSRSRTKILLIKVSLYYFRKLVDSQTFQDSNPCKFKLIVYSQQTNK